MVDWVGLAYGLGVPIAVGFAVYALVYAYYLQRKHRGATDIEGFITARSSQSLWRIGWSFYASAVGAWVISAPPLFASSLGIVGVAVYAITSGLPILMIAFFGERITRALPHALSLSDYMGWRYGPIMKTLVVMICIFNMSIALLAEYSAIGSIFLSFVGTQAWPIVLTIGVLTLVYTAYGGLVVSIATDQVQGIASALLFAVMTIYVAVTFRQPIPNPLPEGLGPNYYGYVSIFTLGISLATATVFSEAMWQRVWASENVSTLRKAAGFGSVLVTIAVFLSGFGGWLALVGGLANEETDMNIILMQVFGSTPNSAASLNSALGLITVLLAIVMNEGAVDSLQNGLACAVSGQWLKNRPLTYARLGVVLINVPLIILGTQGYSVLQVFLVANMLCTCAAFPVVIGLWHAGRAFFTETSAVFGTLLAIGGVSAAGTALQYDAEANPNGAYYVWYGNANYDWPPFLIALVFSVGGTLLWAACGWALRRFAGVRGPGISGVLMRLPGMRWLTGSPHWGSAHGADEYSVAPAYAAHGDDDAAAAAAADVKGSASSKDPAVVTVGDGSSVHDSSGYSVPPVPAPHKDVELVQGGK